MENKNNYQRTFWSKTGKILNYSWKVAIVVIGILAAIFIVAGVREYNHRHYSQVAHEWDRHLSENICVHSIHRYWVRVYDLEAKKYVTRKLKWVSGIPDRDSLTVFCDKSDKRGFLNTKTGEIVIAGKYEHAWVFSEGLAAVVEPGGKMGFIDKSGKYVIAPELDYISSHDYVFKHGVCCIEDEKGYQGLLLTDGTWILPQEYSFISYIDETDMFVPMKNGKYGLLKNGSFEWVYPLEYDAIHWTDAPSGKGFILYKDFQSVHVSVDGKVIDPFLVDETKKLMYMSKYHSDEADEYEISDKVFAFSVNGLWGVMDKQTCKVLIPAKYGSVDMVSENVIQCWLEDYEIEGSVLYDFKGNRIE